MAIIRTIKGGKSNFHMRASNMKPSCKNVKDAKHSKNIGPIPTPKVENIFQGCEFTYYYTNCNRDSINLHERITNRSNNGIIRNSIWPRAQGLNKTNFLKNQ